MCAAIRIKQLTLDGVDQPDAISFGELTYTINSTPQEIVITVTLDVGHAWVGEIIYTPLGGLNSNTPAMVSNKTGTWPKYGPAGEDQILRVTDTNNGSTDQIILNIRPEKIDRLEPLIIDIPAADGDSVKLDADGNLLLAGKFPSKMPKSRRDQLIGTLLPLKADKVTVDPAKKSLIGVPSQPGGNSWTVKFKDAQANVLYRFIVQTSRNPKMASTTRVMVKPH